MDIYFRKSLFFKILKTLQYDTVYHEHEILFSYKH